MPVFNSSNFFFCLINFFLNETILDERNDFTTSQLINSSKTDKTNIGVMQKFRSLGEHINLLTPTFSQKNVNKNVDKKTISVSTGYLNLKDVFYCRSLTELPEYVNNKERFRSICSLKNSSTLLENKSNVHICTENISNSKNNCIY